MPLTQLPPATVKLIGSSQVITSVSSVVKELMENSIDSGAQQIEIKLEKHGLEKIEVKDDGCGVAKSDVTVMCLASHTSKISDFSDLDSLSSYGFRGEALSSLCNVANVSITTKTTEDNTATCYTFDQNGQVTCSKTSHIVKGTIVTVTELFKKLPVRKQFMSNSKRAAEELKKIEKLVKCLAVVHPRLRVTLVHNKFLCWQKTSVANLRQSVMQVVSLSMAKQLHHILHNTEQIRVEMLVPKSDCDISTLCFSNFSDAYFLFINQRPVRHKEVEKTVYDKLFEYFGVYMPVNKYPLCVTCLRVPPECLDVNLEPNKTRVYLRDQEKVLDIIKQCMLLYYGNNRKEPDEDDASKPIKKRKIEPEHVEVDPKKVILSTFNNEIIQEEAQEQIEENQRKGKDWDCAFVNYCLEKGKDVEDTAVGKSSSNHVECLSEKNKMKCSNVVSNSISSNSGFGRAQRNDSSLEDYNNTNHIQMEKDISKTKYLKLSPELEEADKFGQRLVLPGIAAETLHEEDNDVNISEEHSEPFPPIEGIPVVCESIVDSEEGAMTLVLEDSPLFSIDSGKGSQEDSSPTLSQWSRGEVKTSLGTFVKGSCVLTNAMQSVSPQSSDKSMTQSSQSLDRSVASQMGCKEMSAFTKFARNMRKHILEENPHMSFTRVAQQLQVKWRELDVDKKKQYEEGTLLKKAVSPSAGPKQKTLTEMKHVLSTKTPNIELDININILQQMVKRTKDLKNESNCLIGRLEASPLWLYRDPHSFVTVLSAPRLMEAVKFHQHLSNFAVPSKLLDNFLPIYSSDIGEAQWSLLLSLEKSANGVVKDLRILNNGFVVEIGDAEAQLTYVPKHISNCGVEELQEVLNLLQTYGPEATLYQCRTLRITSYLRSEVMRECSLQDPPSESQEVSSLLHYWLCNVIHQTQNCIHHFPVTQFLNIS